MWNTDGYQCGRYIEDEKTASLRKLGVGGAEIRRRFPAEMQRMRTSDHDSPEAFGEKCKRDTVMKFCDKIQYHDQAVMDCDKILMKSKIMLEI